MVPPHGTQYTPDDESASGAVLRAIAAIEGVPPAELYPPLARVVDTDALNVLVDGSDAELAITFEYRGHRITVSDDGRIEIANDPT